MNGELVPNDRLQRERLERLEGEIEDAQRHAYLTIGLRLKEIRERELYKIPRLRPIENRYSFETWEEYVGSRWGMDIRRAQQMILASETVTKMRTIVRVLPARESHVRELLKLESDKDRATVWKQIADAHKDGRGITGRYISQEVKKFQTAKKKDWITLEEWGRMDDEQREESFAAPDLGKTFNKQDNAMIEWAQWSWNPITGCKHDCPYCYARDIAERFYPQGFLPAIYPSRLRMPRNSKVPKEAETDARYRNVFTCSMADLFGRWVPGEWIQSVLDVIQDNGRWNFLTLTKFPKRIREFQIPNNAWMGTTIDMQARVASAEKAFAGLDCGIKWVSVEPMLEPIVFSDVSLFDWVVIGGASKSSRSPEWRPPFEWVLSVVDQCRDAGVPIYFKTNLLDAHNRRLLQLPFGAPIENNPMELPESLRYLGK